MPLSTNVANALELHTCSSGSQELGVVGVEDVKDIVHHIWHHRLASQLQLRLHRRTTQSPSSPKKRRRKDEEEVRQLPKLAAMVLEDDTVTSFHQTADWWIGLFSNQLMD